MAEKRVLGLDLGANSVGWALIQFKGNRPRRIAAAGSRIFDAGVEGQLETGREESRTVERRDARQRRRQANRQTRRMGNVCKALQAGGLLPECHPWSGTQRHEMLHTLDRDIYEKHATETVTKGVAQLPYYLRLRALDHKLDPHELGRAFYHLAQRRGFVSNRKTGGDDEETGTVKPAISELERNIEAVGARTLGEYLSRFDPVEEERLRGRWTGREMYEHEFESIWTAQSEYHPNLLTDELKKDVHHAIFHQRDLKSQKGLIGKCEFEITERRAPWALLHAQSFRLRQRINDLIIHFFDGTSRALTEDERDTLAQALEQKEKLTFAQVRKLLGVKKCELNLERGGEKNLIGNTTAAKLRKAIGKHWDELDSAQQQALVGELMGVDNEETMRRRGIDAWGLDEEAAKALAGVRLQQGYCALSRKALKKILPRLEAGEQYATACKNAYEDAGWAKIATAFVPTVEHSALNLRNPAVIRVLTELRKVVNAIIREHGKPDEIHIELARDLKRPPKARQKIWKRNRALEKERKRLKDMLEANGIANPSRNDIQKAQLWEECNHECPYTGKSISLGALFGETAQFDVEHIIPFSRCLDDSFLNKTLCYHEENRRRKGNRTPYETYTEPELDDILERVKKFEGDAKKRKLELFRTKEVKLDEFISRQLNDTRYASREAMKFLGHLYGEEARSRVIATTGQATGYERSAWNLNSILGDGGKKSRDDHRHHAIDAIVVALTDRAMIKKLADAAKTQTTEKGRSRGWWNRVEQPWDGFLEDVQRVVDGITVSHRVSRRVSGRLHEDTHYTAPRKDEDGSEYVAVRKPLTEAFKQKDIENIVDPAVRNAVQDWFEEHAGDSKAAFANPENHPHMPNGVPIHRVRIKKKDAVFPIGKGRQKRYVTNDSNHHVEIIEYQDNKGRTKWEGIVISRFDAVQRARQGKPVIQRDHGNGKRFVFSLGLDECVRMKDDDGEWGLYRVVGVSWFSTGRTVLDFQLLSDARLISKIDRKGRTRSPDTLRKSEATKVAIDPLGGVSSAND